MQPAPDFKIRSETRSPNFPAWYYLLFVNRTRRLFFAAIFAWSAGRLAAAEAPLTPDQIKQAAEVESITIPMPGEFFAAIDKLGRPNWTQLVRIGTPQTTSSRAQMALALGTLVADGYIAVEAQDSQGVKNIGKEIINLAKKLNVSQSVIGRGNSINDFAENNDWNALREELEATQNEVKLDMEEQKDRSLITLVTLGAWVRGTDLVSGLVVANYSPESARLLRQPAIIEYLVGQVDALPKGLQTDPCVMKVRTVLQESLDYLKSDTPSQEDIVKLHQGMSSVVAAIAKGP